MITIFAERLKTKSKTYQPVMKSQYTKEIQDYYEHLSVPDNSGRMKAVCFFMFFDRFSI